jgi:hypothetical protein
LLLWRGLTVKGSFIRRSQYEETVMNESSS